MDSDNDNDEPPPGWTKSKSEWEWEQARHNRLQRVAQKIKTPAKKEKVQPGATQPDDTSLATSMSTCTASSEAFPEAPIKKIAPPPPTPKEVGIGMKIGDLCPHEVTGFVKGGAAAECGLISEGDKLLQVDLNDVTNVSTQECSKYILGPEGSEIKLKFERPTQERKTPRPVRMIVPPKLVGVGLILDIKKRKNGTLVHNVGGVAPEGAAGESGRIAANDQLVAVNGKDCSKLDGKQLNALIVGPEGSSITLEFLRDSPEAAANKSDDSKNEKFEVLLIRGGSAYKKKLDDEEMAYQKLIEQYDKEKSAEPELYEVKLFRGGSEGRLRVQAELEAHRKLVEKVEEENMQAETAYIEELLQRHKRLQALCDLKDSKIAQEADTSALLRKDIARLQDELEKAAAEAKAEAEAKAASEKAAAEKAAAEKAAADAKIAKAQAEAKAASEKAASEKAAAAKAAADAKATAEAKAEAEAKAKAEAKAMNTKIKEQKDEIDKLKLELETAKTSETCKTDLETRIQDLENRLAKTQAETAEQVARSLRALNDTKAERDALAVRVDDMQELKTALQTEIETLKAALQKAGHETSKNSRDTVQANAAFADQADGMGVAIKKLEDNLTAVNGKTQEVDKEIWRLKTNFAEQQEHLDSYKRQVEASRAREDAASSQAKYELQLVQAELVDEQHRRRALAVELESAKRECVVLEAFAERQQALIQQGIRDIETLQHVKAYAEKMLQLLPGALELLGIIQDEDKKKKSAMFDEIVRVRDENTTLKDTIRKKDAKLEDFDRAKRVVENLEGQLRESSTMLRSERNTCNLLVGFVRTVEPLDTEVAEAIAAYRQVIRENANLKDLVFRQRVELDGVKRERHALAARVEHVQALEIVADKAERGLQALCAELAEVCKMMRRDFSKVEALVSSQNRNMQAATSLAERLVAELQDKRSDVARLDEMLCKEEEEKRRIAELLAQEQLERETLLHIYEETREMLDRERQEKIDAIRSSTQSLALAQASADKQAWIFQSRIEKEELALLLAERDDEVVVLQRKVREATNLEKASSKKNGEFVVQVNVLKAQVKQLSVHNEQILLELERAKDELSAEKALSSALGAQIDAQQAHLTTALGALKADQQINDLVSSYIANESGAPSNRVDFLLLGQSRSLSMDRDALITTQVALEADLESKCKQVEKLHNALRDQEAEWEVQSTALRREIQTLKAGNTASELNSVMIANKCMARQHRVVAYLSMFEGRADRKWTLLLKKSSLEALSSNARRRLRMWRLARAFIRIQDQREVDYIVNKFYKLWRSLVDGNRDYLGRALSAGGDVKIDGFLLLRPVQLTALTHQDLCAHVSKLQLCCTNLQHKLTNVTTRATRAEHELQAAAENVARLKRNVSVVSKVGTIIQQQNGQQRNSVDHKALPYTHLTHRKEWNGAPHPGSPSVAASVPGWGQRPSMQ